MYLLTLIIAKLVVKFNKFKVRVEIVLAVFI